MTEKRVDRRQFLKGATGLTAGAFALPYFVPSSALGAAGVAPSERITIGCIGVGGQGTGNMNAFLNKKKPVFKGK